MVSGKQSIAYQARFKSSETKRPSTLERLQEDFKGASRSLMGLESGLKPSTLKRTSRALERS